jgi:4-amino-4-deoxy-L-arabinose transferase-like glycosyltransferase
MEESQIEGVWRWAARPRVWAAIVCAAAAVVVLTNLGGPPLWDDDEPKNAACTLAMLAADDWVVPRFNGALRSDKPPLVNWLQMAGYAILGPTESGARLPSALLTIGTSLLTGATAAVLFPSLPLVGLWAGLAMGTCVWTGIAGRAATPDAGLCFFTTLALLVFARAVAPCCHAGAAPRLSHRAAAMVGAALGAAVLAKGPVGVVLPLAAFLTWGWWQALAANAEASIAPRSLQSLLTRACSGIPAAITVVRPFTILAVAVAVAAPWYGLVWFRTGGQWIRDFLFVHNVQRFAGPLEGHGGPPFYYLIVLAVGFFPWSIVAALTLADAWKSLRRPQAAVGMRLLAAWAVVWLGCFTVAGTKLPGYVWPAYPALAIATAAFLERWRLDPLVVSVRWMHVGWSILAAAGIGIAIGVPAAVGSLGSSSPLLGLIGIVPCAAAVVAWIAQASGRRGASLAALATAGCLTVMLLAAIGADRLGRRVGVRPLVAAAGVTGDTEAWASYRCSVPGLVFYSGAAARNGAVPKFDDIAAVGAFFSEHPDGRVVMPGNAFAQILAEAPQGHAVLARAASLTRHKEYVLIGPAPAGGTPRTAAHTDLNTSERDTRR